MNNLVHLYPPLIHHHILSSYIKTSKTTIKVSIQANTVLILKRVLILKLWFADDSNRVMISGANFEVGCKDALFGKWFCPINLVVVFMKTYDSLSILIYFVLGKVQGFRIYFKRQLLNCQNTHILDLLLYILLSFWL
jgi:hypothetical protein